MTIEKVFGIDRVTVQRLIDATKDMTHKKTGDNRFQQTKVFLFDEYAVLKMQNINVRNVVTQDTDLKHLEMLTETLLALKSKGVNVVPILAFRSDGGNGYIIQQRANGSELYDRERMSDKDYIMERVRLLASVTQKHYDKFVADAIEIMSVGVLIDFMGKDNFFYHEATGFQFIDLNAHFDYVYGITDAKQPADTIAAWNCFLPCYFDTAPNYRDTVSALLSKVIDEERAVLRGYNRIIFAKCKAAIYNNGIPDEMVDEIIANERFIPQKQQLELI